MSVNHPCLHCGKAHSSEARFCPTTGEALTLLSIRSRRSLVLFASLGVVGLGMIVVGASQLLAEVALSSAPRAIAVAQAPTELATGPSRPTLVVPTLVLVATELAWTATPQIVSPKIMWRLRYVWNSLTEHAFSKHSTTVERCSS